MGVKAPVGIQRFYYIAYPTGLIIAFVVYYLTCLVSNPPGMEKGAGWMEPKDYVGDEDVSGIGSEGYDSIDGVGIAEKGSVAVTTAVGEKGGY
jgi:NCS1 family nucleobase:cation symporter-1